jgi:ABC-2 type transport system ATP-binding protein
MSDLILQTIELTKRYSRRILAVDELNLEVTRGQVFGLLGPNGSGKTTTLGMILGVVSRTKGEYNWFGKGDDYKLRKNIGAILEQPNFYPFLSARQNLTVHSKIKDIDKPDTDGLLKLVGLLERSNDPFRTYSLGMKQRLAIASALLADPDVLIFDEPTNGLDPQGIAEIRKLILDIRDMGKTIVLASHLLDEVQKVCSHFAVLRRGKKIFTGSVQEVLYSTNTIAVGTDDEAALRNVLSSCQQVKSVESHSSYTSVMLTDDWTASQLNAFLVERGIAVYYLEKKKSSLEEKFLEILREDDQHNHTAQGR